MDLILVLIALSAGVFAALPDGRAGYDMPEVAKVPVDEPELAPAPEPTPKFAPLPEAETAEAPPLPKFAPLPDAGPTPKFAPLPEAETPASGFIAEDQTPSGKFTTAGEVRMILDATKGSWVALRDFNGQDLLYFTQILSWRCGLVQIEYAVNDGPAQVFPAEPCYIDTAQPNAIKAEGQQPYLAFPPGSVQSVTVKLTYDDLATAQERFERSAIMMP